MSRKYKGEDSVPSTTIVNRLRDLSNACVAKLNGDIRAFNSEFTFRYPTKLERDPDTLLDIAANRLEQLETQALQQKKKIAELEDRLEMEMLRSIRYCEPEEPHYLSGVLGG